MRRQRLAPGIDVRMHMRSRTGKLSLKKLRTAAIKVANRHVRCSMQHGTADVMPLTCFYNPTSESSGTSARSA